MSERSDLTEYSSPFLEKLTEIILQNVSDENFGVSELANEIGMSRSNLLRKIKKETNLSASCYIRKVRLEKAMQVLRESDLNVSEVSYQVGFGSVSYFVKCFREQYGYPPGEVGSRKADEVVEVEGSIGQQKKFWFTAAMLVVFSIAVSVFVIFIRKQSAPPPLEVATVKSIAVLPFIDDSNDSSNVHIVNGLMESIIYNLQNVEDLRVISRTSVEKYRTERKTIPEIAEELNVAYVVEGSGQKIGDQIMLNVQLIDAQEDRHLWGEQYQKEAEDIFNLQLEVAESIAGEIEVIIRPEVRDRISKPATENLVAYEYFLKGMDSFYQETYEGLEEAIVWFEKAIEEDPEFARAYADIAISYYYMDLFNAEKEYLDEINHYADQAILYDSQLPQSMVAKGLYYLNNREFAKALPHFKKALEFNPNSAFVVNILSDYYANYVPNTEEYLKYALKALQLDPAASDSITTSYSYLHVANAFVQSGFIDLAKRYIDISLEYNPENLFSEYVKAYILLAEDFNLERTSKLLLETFDKDTTRLDVLQEVAKIYYYRGEYDTAYAYFDAFDKARKFYNLNIFNAEDAKIAVVMDSVGENERAKAYLENFYQYALNDESLYKHMSLSAYYSYTGDLEKSVEHMRRFSDQDDYSYWVVLMGPMDPLLQNVQDDPDYQEIWKEIEQKFWERHERIKEQLEEERLI